MINRKCAEELSYISKLTGQSELMVQAGGGNTSVKQDERTMLIKASGYHLTDITPDTGYSVVDHRKICDFFGGDPDDSQEQEILAGSLLEGKRPSIETFLHSITRKYTIHSHPLRVTVLASCQKGLSALRDLFPDAVYVDYATPGIKLAKKYYQAAANTKSDVVFLKNHGLIVSADTVEDVLALQYAVINKIEKYLKRDMTAFDLNLKLFAEINKIDPALIAYHVRSEAAAEAAKRSGGEWSFKYSPDCVVFCGRKFFVSGSDNIAENLNGFVRANGIPKIAVIDGTVFVIAESVDKAKKTESVLNFTAEIYLSEFDKFDLISDAETDFLLNWNSEKYRSGIR